MSNGSIAAAAVGRRIVKTQLNNSLRASPALRLSKSRLNLNSPQQPPPLPASALKPSYVQKPPPLPPKPLPKKIGPQVRPKTRPRTKSWGHLQSQEQDAVVQRRYITRSQTKKVSKSMSELNVM